MRIAFRAYSGSLLLSALLGFAISRPAQANSFIIVPTYDSSITSSPDSTAIEAAINLAIQPYESIITTPETVSIYFEGMSSGLGLSDTVNYFASYQSYYDGLVAANANPAAIAALQANGGDGDTNGGVNPVTGTATIMGKAPDFRAVGISAPPACQLTTSDASKYGTSYLCTSPGPGNPTLYDGVVGLNLGITSPPETLGSGTYGLVSVAEHEIDEILGLGSALKNVLAISGIENAANDTTLGDPTPEDLFRWSAASGGTRTLSTNCANPTSAYFSYGPSTGAIAQFNNSCNGADFGDWASSAIVRVQDAFGTPGTNPALSSAELAALTAIGYQIPSADVPEPSTWRAVFGALAALAYARRRRRR
jgi:hypothetical protein